MSEMNTGPVQEQLSKPGSSIKKYQQSVVGDGSIVNLMLYEVINFVCMSFPGRFGRTLRRFGLSLISDHIGTDVQLGTNILILQPRKLHIGDHVRIGDNVTLGIKSSGEGIDLKENVSIGADTILNCVGATISIGKATQIKDDCRLGSLKGLSVGESCIIGRQTCISGAGHASSDLNQPIIRQPLVSKGHTVIEDDVEIGERVTILDGIHIGSKSKIADDSLVIRNIPSGSQVEGVPAKSCF
jgi:acetyltransferase-like isoleucine patch superfamily enzyme